MSCRRLTVALAMLAGVAMWLAALLTVAGMGSRYTRQVRAHVQPSPACFAPGDRNEDPVTDTSPADSEEQDEQGANGPDGDPEEDDESPAFALRVCGPVVARPLARGRPAPQVEQSPPGVDIPRAKRPPRLA